MTEQTTTTHKFQAEVSKVLSLVINSLYSNKEIFLRELVSNASDALDKLRFRGIADPALLPQSLRIRIGADEEAGTLTISDNGVGMSQQELVENLGTVAQSGTQSFLSQLEQGADVSLIGQFGVGFYSGYLVADRIEVLSRAAGSEDAYQWSSNGEDEFTVEPAERDEAGTDIILHLKDEHKELTGPWKLIGKLLSLFACTAFSNCWKFNGLMPGGSLFLVVAFFNVISVHGVGTFPVFIATGVSCACSEP